MKSFKELTEKKTVLHPGDDALKLIKKMRDESDDLEDLVGMITWNDKKDASTFAQQMRLMSGARIAIRKLIEKQT